MKTLFEIIERSAAYLLEKGVERPRREAEEVIADALEMKRLDLYLQFERPVDEKELVRLREVVKRRGSHEPTAYIAGKVEFAGLSINVTPAVLIPRPETELLVEKISQTLSQRDLKGKTLWDVCCGSGCIGLALKKRFPQLNVVLSDLSVEALAVARSNGGEEVTYRQGDLFAPFEGETCDFLVSNPPYVTEEEYGTLSPGVKAEPKMALVGGLTFYERIAAEFPRFLNEGGALWLEMGSGQGEVVHKLFGGCGVVEHDWAGHTRFYSII